MKRVGLVNANTVEVKPFVLSDFTQGKAQHSMMKKVSKKELKILAKTLELNYDEAQLIFAKKLLTAYLEQQ